MTVSELIEELKKFSPHVVVLTVDSNYGFTHVYPRMNNELEATEGLRVTDWDTFKDEIFTEGVII